MIEAALNYKVNDNAELVASVSSNRNVYLIHLNLGTAQPEILESIGIPIDGVEVRVSDLENKKSILALPKDNITLEILENINAQIVEFNKQALKLKKLEGVAITHNPNNDPFIGQLINDGLLPDKLTVKVLPDPEGNIGGYDLSLKPTTSREVLLPYLHIENKESLQPLNADSQTHENNVYSVAASLVRNPDIGRTTIESIVATTATSAEQSSSTEQGKGDWLDQAKKRIQEVGVQNTDSEEPPLATDGTQTGQISGVAQQKHTEQGHSL